MGISFIVGKKRQTLREGSQTETSAGKVWIISLSGYLWNRPEVLMAGMQEFNQDKDLFHLIAAGDEAAFRRLFHLHVPKLLPTVQHLTKNAAITEDILQEAFLKLWLNRDKLPEIEQPYSWLLKIVYYQCFSYLRHQAVHRKAMGVIAERLSENAMEDDMAFNTLMRTVGEAVQQLSPQAKRIYQLSREKGLKIPEIAEQLHISPNTVKNSLVRSLQSIRHYIERAGHFLPLFILWYFF